MKAKSTWRNAALMSLLVLWSVLVLGGIAAADQLQSPPAQCGGLADARAELKTKWGEELIGRGLMPTGIALAFFTDAAGDTFTVLLVYPDGTACVAASGTGWKILPPPAPGQEG